MKVLNKTIAAVTSAAIMASAAVPGITGGIVFSFPGISADETENLNYSFSISSETYDYSTLKTYEYYEKNNLVSTASSVAALKDGSLNRNKVAEVTLKIDENAGFNVIQFILDYDEKLTFAGCAVIEGKTPVDEDYPPISYIDKITDDRINVSAKMNKVIVSLKDGTNLVDTGEFVKLLFVLPSDIASGDTYSVGLSDKTKNQIARWDGKSDITYSSKSGGISVSGVETSGTSDKLSVSDIVSKFDLANPIELENGASADMKADCGMAIAGNSTVKYTLRLSDFDKSTDYFNYGLIGINLPDGVTFKSAKVNSDKYTADDYLTNDSLYTSVINKKTEFEANGGYIMLNGIDTSKFSADEVLCEIELDVPADKIANSPEVTFAYAFAREREDGSIAAFKTASGSMYNEVKVSEILTGLRGDVNLDGKVDQFDATLVLKEALSLEMSGSSILKENIKTETAGDADKAVALSHFLGDVDSSDNGRTFEQLDATVILRTLLAADLNGVEVTEDLWAKFI